ncbi:hypothetical protein TCAL_06961 [Tigriopus californicus]|uniref:Neurotransmitter-gated ion-channel ligand-binding domain-containing protein n=2 Tax=Tigriopus californicus TaxID=6832 RepID=A0A553PI11_TIGCA|nr:glycine receptor subunit alpha-2-like isoform X1 [Tigriopus californicus]TRY77326.1 hypothetical protein TCAL_06961 [Tigriopus californicus]
MWATLTVTCLLINALLGQSTPTSFCVSGLCLPMDYNKLEMPPGRNDIKIELTILDVLSVNDKDFSISVYAYLGIRWPEPRLIGKNGQKLSTYSDERLGVPITVDPAFLSSVWVPNIMIVNVKSFKPLSEMKPQQALWAVSESNGQFGFYYVQGCIISFYCPMRFDFFPLDAHICPLQLSTNYNNEHVFFSETILNDASKSRNVVLEYSLQIKKIPDGQRMLATKTLGNYSTTGVEFYLERHKLKYLSIYFLPSGLFVVVSWVSFLIPPDQVAGRMSMLITLFLVLVNIFGNITSTMPNTEGVTAISGWMIVCIFFVFGALCCYAFLLWKMKPTFYLKKHERTPEDIKSKHWQRVKFDDWCFMIFPIVFVLFNIAYWAICLNTPPSEEIAIRQPFKTVLTEA